jgi:hypothetical protein
MSDDRERLHRILREVAPRLEPELVVILGVLIEKSELFPSEAPTVPRNKPPPVPTSFEKVAKILEEAKEPR